MGTMTVAFKNVPDVLHVCDLITSLWHTHLCHKQELSLLERTKMIRQYGVQMLSHTQSGQMICNNLHISVQVYS